MDRVPCSPDANVEASHKCRRRAKLQAVFVSSYWSNAEIVGIAAEAIAFSRGKWSTLRVANAQAEFASSCAVYTLSASLSVRPSNCHNISAPVARRPLWRIFAQPHTEFVSCLVSNSASRATTPFRRRDKRGSEPALKRSALFAVRWRAVTTLMAANSRQDIS